MLVITSHSTNTSLSLGVYFNGGGEVQMNNITLRDPYGVIAVRNPNVPLFVDLGPDQGSCQSDITLNAQNPQASTYLWSTGATSPSIQVNQTGTYWVQVQDQDDKQASDTIQVTIEEPLVFQLPDSLFSVSSLNITSPVSAFTYLWSTGETTPSINVSASGWYRLTLSTEFGCESQDSVYVALEEIAIFQGGIGDGADKAILENTEAFFQGGLSDGFSKALILNTQAFFEGGVGDGFSLDTLSGGPAFYLGGSGQGYDAFLALDSGSFYRGGLGDGFSLQFLLHGDAFYEGGQGDGYASLKTPLGPAFYQGGAGDGYALQDQVEKVITSIRNALPQFEVKVFPNPASEWVHLRQETENTPFTYLKIYDKQGKILLEQELNAQEIRLDVQHLSPGVYLLEFQGPLESQKQSLRLLIE